jgi:hypothetical protein
MQALELVDAQLAIWTPWGKPMRERRRKPRERRWRWILTPPAATTALHGLWIGPSASTTAAAGPMIFEGER